TMNVAVEMRNSAPTSTAVLLYWFMSSFIGRCCVLMGEVVIFVSFSLVFVFVCVMSVLLLQVLLRCFLEPSHTCFLPSNACGESDRLLDTRRDRVGYQQEGTLCKRIIRAFGNPQRCLPSLGLEALMCA